jgi:hypothetical protein
VASLERRSAAMIAAVAKCRQNVAAMKTLPKTKAKQRPGTEDESKETDLYKITSE